MKYGTKNVFSCFRQKLDSMKTSTPRVLRTNYIKSSKKARQELIQAYNRSAFIRSKFETISDF
jgi:hypothetical protein